MKRVIQVQPSKVGTLLLVALLTLSSTIGTFPVVILSIVAAVIGTYGVHRVLSIPHDIRSSYSMVVSIIAGLAILTVFWLAEHLSTGITDFDEPYAMPFFFTTLCVSTWIVHTQLHFTHPATMGATE